MRDVCPLDFPQWSGKFVDCGTHIKITAEQKLGYNPFLVFYQKHGNYGHSQQTAQLIPADGYELDTSALDFVVDAADPPSRAFHVYYASAFDASMLPDMTEVVFAKKERGRCIFEVKEGHYSDIRV